MKQETNSYAQKLYLSNFLREPVIRSAIQSMNFPTGSCGLDAGCGIGYITLWLAEAVGPTGHITGLDISHKFITQAREIAKKSCMSEQVTFQEGVINELPFDDNTFDWIWSVDCAGYPTTKRPQSLLKEFTRVVKSGGSVVILAWSSQNLLPGYPLLEARLNATCSGYAPFVRDKQPESHFLRALGRFKEAGLEDAEAFTFTGNAQVPLSDNIRRALISLFDMLWGEQQPEVSKEDWSEYQRLCQPESPEFILNCSDYFAFFTYSMFRGRVPE